MAKTAAKGTVLAYENPSTTWNTIPNVGDFDIPLIGTKDEIDVTTHDSSGGFEETILGIARTQSFTVPLIWDGTNTHHAYLRTAAAADTLVAFKVTCVDTKVLTFSGYVKGITLSNPVNGAFSATVEVKISGNVTFT
jgi:predicted secreted protein